MSEHSHGAATRAAAGPHALRPLKLLVVDDNRVNRLLLSSILGRLGHAVDVAEDGAAAVALVRGGAYDAVLMDFQMPGMDGFETTRQIRSLGGGAGQTPVIGVSADADATTDLRPTDCGMNAAVCKPIIRETLLRVIDSCLPTPAHDLGAIP